MNKKIRGLHSSPGVYSKFTDVEYGNIINKGRKIIKSTDDGISSGGGGGVTPGPKPNDYSKEYFTITALEDNVRVYFSAVDMGGGISPNKTIEYSTDKKTWQSVTSTLITEMSGEVLLTPFSEINQGEKIYFKGLNDSYAISYEGTGELIAFNFFTCLPARQNNIINFSDYDPEQTSVFDVSGNIMSLIYGDDFVGKTELTLQNTCCFGALFYRAQYLRDASNLILPATKLSDGCYFGMFIECFDLLYAPELPAETLTTMCYFYMFNKCVKLSLVKCLATDISAEGCTEDWLDSVNETGTFIKHPDMEDWELDSNDGIPEGWTVVDYSESFIIFTALQEKSKIGLSKLSTNQTLQYSIDGGNTWVDMTPKTTITLYNIDDMVYVRGTISGDNDATNYTQFKVTGSVKASGDINYIWQSTTRAIGLKKYCGYNLFNGCTGLSDVRELVLSPIELSEYCYANMFSKCTNITVAPSLPAVTLIEGCYMNMFNGCSKLANITCLAKDINAVNCTKDWVNGVADTGVFALASGVEWPSGNSGIPSSWEKEVMSKNYLCIEVLEDGVVSIEIKDRAHSDASLSSSHRTSFSMSIDGGRTWSTWNNNGESGAVLSKTVNTGDEVLIKGVGNENYESGGGGNFKSARINSTCRIKAKGNPLSYFLGDNFEDVHTSRYEYSLCTLFGHNEKLVDASELDLSTITTLTNYCYAYMFSGCTSLTETPVLPATTLAEDCYSDMFRGCTSLTTVPALPATTLAGWCYDYMFDGCTSLTTAPALPATTLASGCYADMFRGCSGLTTAPVLPATTLVGSCYRYMFEGCTRLNYIKCLATNISATNCTYDWLNGVSSTGTFVKEVSMNNWTTGTNGIPNGWTIEDYPVAVKFTANQTNSTIGLNTISSNQILEYSTNYGTTWETMTTATTITLSNTGDAVYIRGLLSGNNTSTNYTKFKMTGNISVSGNINTLWNYQDLNTALKEYCGYCLFSGCTALTSVSGLTLPATTLTDSCYRSMFSGCTSLTETPVLPATTLRQRCYASMFIGCTSLTTVHELPATTLAGECYSHMFCNCTSLTSAPELPATTLASNCYASMFSDCTNLTTVQKLPATTLAICCYQNMFSGCTKLNYIKCLATDISAFSCIDNWVSGVSNGGIFIKDSNMTSWTTGDDGIPSGWAVYNDGDLFTIMAKESNSTIGLNKLSTNQTLEYSTNGNTWTSMTTATTITLTSNCNIVFVRGILSADNTTANCTTFKMTGSVSASGNINILWNYQDLNAPLKEYCGYSLFSGCTALSDVSSLMFPSTTLSSNCYRSMFYGCSGLTTVPVLPATTLVELCYRSMFYNCNSLTQTPVLPATTLAESCYSNMFGNCSGLTTAPALPVTTLAKNCYNGMFDGCTSLINAPVLPATTLATSCYYEMFRRCSGLTAAPALPATTLTDSCYFGMFSGCTSLTDAPELPATTLARTCYGYMFESCKSLTTTPELPATTLVGGCYEYMFRYCSGLTTTPELPATTLANNCYTSMFEYCRNLVNAPVLSATTLTDNCYYRMFEGCTSLTTAPALPATTLAQYCYEYMFRGCSGLTTEPELPATTLAIGCYEYMFEGCTNLTTAPELPATTLAQHCYNAMFSGCTSLTAAPVLPATTLANNCYSSMFSGCTSLTTAPALPATTLANQCYQSMFSGCTSLTTAPELPATTLATECYYNMFRECSSLITAPVLPATTLAQHCYHYMFYGCTNLNYIKCLATDISASYCTTNWAYKVSSTGTFVVPNSMQSTWNDKGTGGSGKPSGWTYQDA